MPKGQPARYKKLESGELAKLCRGPSHSPGGEFVPISQYCVIKSPPKGRPGMVGKPRSWCKACETVSKGAEPYILISRVRWIFDELQARLGKIETCRRLGRTQNWLWQFNHGRTRRVRRSTARAAIIALRLARLNNEVRHRDSIHHGAAARGREERVPVAQTDYYRSFGDGDTQSRTQRRRRARERERQSA